MPTESGPPAVRDEPRVVTTLPPRGAVLVRSRGPPVVPADRCVDVRPGPFATFDGVCLRLPLTVCEGDERRRVHRREVGAVEDAILAFLGASRTTSEAGGADGVRPGPDDGGTAVVRFGDRAQCGRRLPRASVRAIEERLRRAADRASAVLLTWTGAGPRAVDGEVYDVVLDRPPAGVDDPVDPPAETGSSGPSDPPGRLD